MKTITDKQIAMSLAQELADGGGPCHLDSTYPWCHDCSRDNKVAIAKCWFTWAEHCLEESSWLLSEIATVRQLLSEISEDEIIERLSMEGRLRSLQEQLAETHSHED